MGVLELDCDILIHTQLPYGVEVKRSIIALPGGPTKTLIRCVKISRTGQFRRSPLYKHPCKASNTYIKKKISSHTLPRTLVEARLG